MTTPPCHPTARTLALLALVACQGPPAGSGEETESFERGVRGVTATVGMWGNDDGWSLVEPLRLGAIDRQPAAPSVERECPRPGERVHPLEARVEKVGAVSVERGPRAG